MYPSYCSTTLHPMDTVWVTIPSSLYMYQQIITYRSASIVVFISYLVLHAAVVAAIAVATVAATAASVVVGEVVAATVLATVAAFVVAIEVAIKVAAVATAVAVLVVAAVVLAAFIITNLPIIAVFVEYLRQFLINLNQIYRHSSVSVNFLSFLAQAVSQHGAAATFFCHGMSVTV